MAVLLMWLYVSTYAVPIGGLINAETEWPTVSDTTTEPEEPMGSGVRQWPTQVPPFKNNRGLGSGVSFFHEASCC